MPVFDLNVYQEIGRWKQEAREEDNERYFFAVPEVQDLLSGDSSFLIDRKGKGKTAVGQSILRQAQLGESLSFKNYPFNELTRSLRDTAYRPANQYTAGWRFVIFSTLARLMVRDEAVDKQKRAVLQKAFTDDVHEALYAKFARWLSGGFRIEAYGSELD